MGFGYREHKKCCYDLHLCKCFLCIIAVENWIRLGSFVESAQRRSYDQGPAVEALKVSYRFMDYQT